MEITLFLNPIPLTAAANPTEPESLFSQLVQFKAGLPFPELPETGVVLLGIPEHRGEAGGALAQQPSATAPELLRQQLYRLTATTQAVALVDIGDLRLGKTPADTQQRLAAVCEYLLVRKLTPVLLGGSHDMSLGQYMAYEALEQLVCVATADARIDALDQHPAAACNHLHQLLVHRPNYLVEYIHLAYQRYLTAPSLIDALNQLNFELHSVGRLRDAFTEAEPLLRSADMFSFDLTAIRRADAPAVSDNTLLGLTAEEACRLCWYAGTSERMSSFGLYGFSPWLQGAAATAELGALLIWYFLEGFGYRQSHQPNGTAYTKYIVPVAEGDQLLTFYKNRYSGKWWVQASLQQEPGSYQAGNLVPCSLVDYQQAQKGILPERWLKGISR